MCLCLRVAVEFDPIYWLHQSLKYLLNINCLLFFLVHQSGKNWQVPGLFFLLLSFLILVFWHATSIFLLTCKDSCIYSHLGLSNTGIWCLGPKIYSEMNFFWALQLLSSSSIILFKLFCYVWVGDVTVFNIVEYNLRDPIKCVTDYKMVGVLIGHTFHLGVITDLAYQTWSSCEWTNIHNIHTTVRVKNRVQRLISGTFCL